jgi:membrane protease subunit HflK
MTMRYVLGLAVFAFLLSLLTGVTQVQPGERAVVRRFGRVLDHRPGPGLYIGLPWGMDQVDRVSVEMVRRVIVGYDPDRPEEMSANAPRGQFMTGDQNLVNLQVTLDYTVIEDEVVDFLVQQEKVEPLLNRAVEGILAEWASSRRVDDVLRKGRSVDPVVLEGETPLPQLLLKKTQERIEPYRLGIRIQSVGVKHLYPPTEVKQHFDRVRTAETEIQTKENQALLEARTIDTGTQTALHKLQQETETYKAAQLLQAEADARTFEERLAKYRELSRSNPYYLNALWWSEMSRLYARMRDNGRIDLLDNRLTSDGLDILMFPPTPAKR